MLALVVVKALADSPWGTFTVAMTIPIAILMGLYLRYFRPGRIMEVSVIGFVLLVLAIWPAAWSRRAPAGARVFHLNGTTLRADDRLRLRRLGAAGVVAAGAARRPSTFLKIGTVLVLAIAILIAMPDLQMPAMTKFVDGTGPVFCRQALPVPVHHHRVRRGLGLPLADQLRHHAEDDLERIQIPLIGYGGMLMEAFVAIMALIAACVLQPGVYFAMNAPAALIGTTAESAAAAISSWASCSRQEMLRRPRRKSAKTPSSRAPAARRRSRSAWRRSCRAVRRRSDDGVLVPLRDPVRGALHPDHGRCRHARRPLHDPGADRPGYEPIAAHRKLGGTTWPAPGVSLWGYFLYQGVVDPLGGINTLWPLFGIANQMLAGMALVFCASVVKMKREKFLWIPLIPTAWLLILHADRGAGRSCSTRDPKIGFIADARKFAPARRPRRGEVLAPAKSMDEMSRVIFNNSPRRRHCARCFFVFVVLSSSCWQRVDPRMAAGTARRKPAVRRPKSRYMRASADGARRMNALARAPSSMARSSPRACRSACRTTSATSRTCARRTRNARRWTTATFFRERQAARYGRSATRCC